MNAAPGPDRMHEFSHNPIHGIVTNARPRQPRRAHRIAFTQKRNSGRIYKKINPGDAHEFKTQLGQQKNTIPGPAKNFYHKTQPRAQKQIAIYTDISARRWSPHRAPRRSLTAIQCPACRLLPPRHLITADPYRAAPPLFTHTPCLLSARPSLR